MSLTRERLQEIGDTACVNIALRQVEIWDGKRIDPRLWEALRLEM